jgi:outer membrane protein assembly factor BamB
MAGKKVFLCYAAEDQYRIPPLLAAFTAWEITPNVLAPTTQPVGQLLPETTRQIRECEVYLRLCTGVTRQSPQVGLADSAFRKLLGKGRKRATSAKRRLVNVILDAAYVPDEEEKATLYIDTAGKTRELWFEELAIPLGVATLKQRVSRRALLGMGVGATLAVVSSGVAATTIIRQQQQAEEATRIIPESRHVSGLVAGKIPLGDFTTQKEVNTALFYDNGVYYAAASSFSEAGLYTISPARLTSKLLPLAFTSSQSVDSSHLNISGGLVFAAYDDTNGTVHPTVFRASDGAIAFVPDFVDYSQPVVVGDAFYCLAVSNTGDTFVGAFDSHTGSPRWQHPIALNDLDLNILGNFSLLAMADGAVYVSAFDHTLTCYDAGTGRQKWRFTDFSGQPSTPVIADDLVYVGARDGSIFAIDAATGAPRWHTSIVAGITAPPTVSNGAVYVGSIEGFLYALDAGTGAFFWNSLLGDLENEILPYSITSAPVLYRNVIAVSAVDILFAYDVRDGSPRWKYEPISGTTTPISPPVMYQGVFLIGSSDGYVYMVNP